MAVPLRSRKVFKYILLLSLVALACYFWPISQIEQLSNSLSAAERNEYIESIINPKKDKLLDLDNDHFKAEFNPNVDNEKIIMDRNKINTALRKLNLKPLSNDNENIISEVENIPILSDTLINLNFNPTENQLNSFNGNINLDSISSSSSSSPIDYFNDLSCTKISSNLNDDKDSLNLKISDSILLNDDLIEVRRWLLNSKYKDLIKSVDPNSNDGTYLSDMNHWFKNSGSSVWLPDEQVHMMVSTIIYAPNKENPLISFIRLQLFDSNWLEIKNRRIRYTGLKDAEIDSALRDYAKDPRDAHFERISLRFPSILQIDYPTRSKNNGEVYGPINTKILFKDGEYSSEPIIFFDMFDQNNMKHMFSVSPLTVPVGPDLVHPITKFKTSGTTNKIANYSKNVNWIPFFDSIKIGDSKTSKGFVYIAYSMNPLAIFKCSLDSGKCTKAQLNQSPPTTDNSITSYLTGGSSFYPIPRQVVNSLTEEQHKRLQLWISFPKLVLNDISCSNNGKSSSSSSSSLFTPLFTVLVKEDGIFRIDMISTPIEIPNTKSICSSSVSINGISFWDIASNGSNNENGKFNDNLGVIFDIDNSKLELRVLKNLMNYIADVYTSEDNYGVYGNYEMDGAGSVYKRTQKVVDCAINVGVSLAQAGNLFTPVDKTTEEWN